MKMEKTSLTTPGTGSSSYLKALTVEIEKKLQRVPSFSCTLFSISLFWILLFTIVIM
jgi:hypothetical protein